MDNIAEINNVPFPYAVVDENKNILSINDCFDEEFVPGDGKVINLKITDLYEGYNIGLKKQTAIIRGKCYQIFTSKTEDVYNVFFIESLCSNDEVCNANKIMLGLIMVDNYIEVQESTEEVRQPYLVAVIDRKIVDFFTNLGGVVRKFEKDKYLFVLNEDKLEHLKETKCQILESIGKIDMGNIPVTLSIGIGLGNDNRNLGLTMDYARGALDLALGRGGNQVVIKEDEDKYQFIGGDGREVSSNSKVRARVKAYGLVELIQSASDVMIMGHKNPDLDCLGAAAGVFAIAHFFDKKCSIVLNKVTSSIKSLYDRLLEDSKYDGAFINNEDALRTIKKRTLLIVLDTHKPSYCECTELLSKAKKIVVFDHHRKSTEFINNADLTYHEAFASSTCELVTEMFMYMNKAIKMTKTETEGLLAGITVDTKNFAFKTGIKTFEAAAYLKRNGADTIEVRRLFQNTLDEYVAKAEVVSKAEVFRGNMAMSALYKEVDCPVVLIAQAADEMLNIAGIEVSYVLCKYDGKVCISARSLGNINVQKLMEILGGGGHQTGAAAQLDVDTIEDGVEILKKTIDEYMQEGNK